MAEYTFVGIAVVTLALAGFATAFEDRVVRRLGGVCAGGLLFALGGVSIFHGVAYLLVPTVEKARTPAFAVVIVQFGLAVLAAYGIDALRVRVIGRRPIALLLAIGILPWPVLAVVSHLRPETSREYQGLAVAGLVALVLAAVLYGWRSKRISERAAVVLIFIAAVFELGTVTGQNFHHREMPAGFLLGLEKNPDVVDFLRGQPDFTRLEADTDALPYNIGDWDGIDQFRSYLGGMTANVAPFEEERLQGGRLAVMLFGLNYSVGNKPFRPGQQEVFRSASGLHIYRNAEAFPRLWTVHRDVSVHAGELIPRLQAGDLRQQVFVPGFAPALEQCGGDDSVQLRERRAALVVLDVRMACKGMVVLSQTSYPGWQAIVDGHGERLYEAYGVLQGVVVNSGNHRIEIRYRPVSVYLGASLTALGLATALALALKTS